MKFLCLHGMGTNSSIFESQLGSIIPHLEAQGHEFVFVDGEIECAPADEIKEYFPGPYFCYYNFPTDILVKQAHAYVKEIIEEEGPFDGVIGFSQGAALAASIILENTKTDPLNDVFKMAIFAGASLPFQLAAETSTIKRFSLLREDSGISDLSSEGEIDSTKPYLIHRQDSQSSDLSSGLFSDGEVDPYTSWRIPKNSWDPVGPVLGRIPP